MVVLASTVMLLGCSSTSEPTAASPVDTTSACDVLNKEQISPIAGTPTGEPTTKSIAGISACLWSVGQSQVQVVRAPASEWAIQLPTLINQLKASGLPLTPEDERQLQEVIDVLEAGGDVDSDDACAIFSKILAVQGNENLNRTVQLIPTRETLKPFLAKAALTGTSPP